MKKHITALALAALLHSGVAFASWETQGYPVDNVIDGTEEVFTENGGANLNSRMYLSTIKGWVLKDVHTAYSSSFEYEADDLVVDGGKLYVSVQGSNTGHPVDDT